MEPYHGDGPKMPVLSLDFLRVRQVCSALLLDFLYDHHLLARAKSYHCICVASAHDAFLASEM